MALSERLYFNIPFHVFGQAEKRVLNEIGVSRLNVLYKVNHVIGKRLNRKLVVCGQSE